MTAVDPRFARLGELVQAGRQDEALRLLNAMAEEDDPMALATLGDFFWRGGPVPRDSRKARDYYRRAGDAGHMLASAYFTNLLASGIFGERDWQAALARLREEAEDDPPRARIVGLIEAMDLDGEGSPRSLPQGRSLAAAPQATLFPGLFSIAECDHLLAVAEPGYRRSTVLTPEGREVPHPVRSSDGFALHWLIEDPVVHALNRRLAAASGTAYDQGEPLLILRYSPGQQYRRHFDALPGLENQRIKTALVYLNEGCEGGETEFPRIGLKVKGRKGDALVFSNTGPDGRADPLSEHAGLPVQSGVKYLASRWIRGRRFLD